MPVHQPETQAAARFFRRGQEMTGRLRRSYQRASLSSFIVRGARIPIPFLVGSVTFVHCAEKRRKQGENEKTGHFIFRGGFGRRSDGRLFRRTDGSDGSCGDGRRDRGSGDKGCGGSRGQRSRGGRSGRRKLQHRGRVPGRHQKRRRHRRE